jgi:hypothetical protein
MWSFFVEYSFSFLFSEVVTDFVPYYFSPDGDFSPDGALGVPAPSLIFFITADGLASGVSYFSAHNSI